jgi:hypothetical protein
MNRRRVRGASRLLVGAIIAVLILVASPLRSFGSTRVPSVTIVSAAPDESGIAAAREGGP